MTTKVVDILFNTKDNSAGADATVNALKKIEAQADKTRNTMQKLSGIGTTLGVTGAAILTPFIVASKKYMDITKQQKDILLGNLSARSKELDAILKNKDATAEEVAEGRLKLKLAEDAFSTFEKQNKTFESISDSSKRINTAITDIGETVADVIAPALADVAAIAEKIAKFSEDNPGAVKAALDIGASLVVLGGFINTTAKIVSTIATVQGLAASAGLALGGGAAAVPVLGTAATAGVGGSLAGSATTAGLSAAFLAVMTNPLTWAVAALLVEVPLLNAILGTHTTLKDIGTTGKQLIFLIGEGWKQGLEGLGKNAADISMNFSQIIDKLGMNFYQYINNAVTNIGRYFSNLGSSILNGIGSMATSIASSIFNGISSFASSVMAGIKNLIDSVLSLIPGHAAGGNIGRGLFVGGENGREFMLSTPTTRAAEQLIGGNLTQQKLLQALAGGGGKNINVHQTLRFSGDIGAADKREIKRISRDAAYNGIISAIGA